MIFPLLFLPIFLENIIYNENKNKKYFFVLTYPMHFLDIKKQKMKTIFENENLKNENRECSWKLNVALVLLVVFVRLFLIYCQYFNLCTLDFLSCCLIPFLG